RGLSRNISIWIIFIIIIALISWGISTLIPLLQEQATAFVGNIPNYQESFARTIESFPIEIEWGLFDPNIVEYFRNIDWNNVTDQLNTIITSTFGGLGSVIGTVAQVVTGLIT